MVMSLTGAMFARGHQGSRRAMYVHATFVYIRLFYNALNIMQMWLVYESPDNHCMHAIAYAGQLSYSCNNQNANYRHYANFRASAWALPSYI